MKWCIFSEDSFAMYDISKKKLGEIDSVSKAPEEAEAFRELYHLPGVKSTGASLYYKAGFGSLHAIASSSPETIAAKTEELIRKEKPGLKMPLMKEITTHIAVAKAFASNFED